MNTLSKNFVNAEDAARLLGVTVQEIPYFVESGFLRPLSSEDGLMYYRSDVVRAMEARDSAKLPTMGHQALIHLQAEITELRTSLNVILDILGIPNRPLVLDEEDLILLYDHILSAITQDEYRLEEISNWCTTLLGLHHFHVSSMVTFTRNDRPWLLLHRLVDRMYVYLSDLCADENVHIRTAMMQVNAARTHIQNLTYVCIEIDPARDHELQMMRQTHTISNVVRTIASVRGQDVLPPAIQSALSFVPPKVREK